jgi:hypothetical protein
MATLSESLNGCKSQRGVWSAVLLPCAVAVWLLSSSGAAAEIFKCKGADGRTLYTSDRSACPGARPHELKAEMQSVAPAPGEGRATAARAARGTRGAASVGGASREATSGSGSGVADGMIEMWRRKRPEAEAKLAFLKKRAEYMRSVVVGCNRGATWYAKDDAGLNQHVSCEELGRLAEEVSKEITELEAYLSGGLEEECRRAGCLPGWIR